jgi:hypothetical protein
MSWRDTFSQLIKKQSNHWIYERIPAARTTTGEEEKLLVPGKSYVRVKLIQMYLGYQRVWVQNRAPVVHSFTKFLSNQGYVEVPIVVGANRLKDDLDGQPLQRVVSLNQTVIGPVPYYGGDFELVIALFAAETKNYAEQFMNLLGSLSSLSVSTELTTALTLLRPIEHGLEQMLGLGDLSLQIGVQDTFSSSSGGNVSNPLRTGYHALIAKEQIDPDARPLWLTERGLCSNDNGKPGELLTGCDYLVFRIEGLTGTKESPARDWRELQSLNLEWKKVEEAIGTGDEGAIDRAFQMFKWTLLGNGDLLMSDRSSILHEQVAQLRSLLEAGKVNLKDFLPESANITPRLAELFQNEVIEAAAVSWRV